MAPWLLQACLDSQAEGLRSPMALTSGPSGMFLSAAQAFMQCRTAEEILTKRGLSIGLPRH